ncbi:hypothetical protein ACFQY0_17125 [Haloferula chungangensis]|uniref:Uncharacterized protein n=1 Tax=Haloferula chungangensis TaxID=1048331 RepID=A0ABW2L940_9BACT
MKLIAMWLLCLLLPASLMAADPGRDEISNVKVMVYHATNGDPKVAGDKALEVPQETIKWLASKESLKFEHYRLLGTDSKPLYRSYENWAQPISGSDEILCRFEVASRLSKDSIRIDLELWLSRKKILKSGVALTAGKPVVVLGPQWRGGRMIVSVELAPPANKGQ